MARAELSHGCIVLAVCLGFGAAGISGVFTPADPQAAALLWTWAEQHAGADLTAPQYLDAAKAAARLRPWHAGYRDARDHLTAIDRARSAP